jgi:hypothetical protein
MLNNAKCSFNQIIQKKNASIIEKGLLIAFDGQVNYPGFFFLLLFLFHMFSIADLSFLPIINIFALNIISTQRPSPYRGLVYADLNHSTASTTGPVKREFPTVYADIDHLKTDTASSKLPEENLDQTTEYDGP